MPGTLITVFIVMSLISALSLIPANAQDKAGQDPIDFGALFMKRQQEKAEANKPVN